MGQYIGYKVSDIPGGPSLPFMLTWMVLPEFVSNHKIKKKKKNSFHIKDKDNPILGKLSSLKRESFHQFSVAKCSVNAKIIIIIIF